MKQAIDNRNLMPLAWAVAKPYLAEAPALLNDEYGWLEQTGKVAEILTRPDLLFDYMSAVSAPADAANAKRAGFGVSARILKTQAFKRVPEDQQMAELLDVANIFACFRAIFTNGEKQVKDNYRNMLEQHYYDYNAVKFCRAATGDLSFKGFNDLLLYFEDLCQVFDLRVVLSMEMAEYICQLMVSVVSRTRKLTRVLSPTYTYFGLLPLYAARLGDNFYNVLSVTLNRCFLNIPKALLLEEETPVFVNFALDRLEKSLAGNPLDYLKPTSVFNSDTVEIDKIRPAKNMFTLSKQFPIGSYNVRIYGYHKMTEDFMAVIDTANDPGCTFVYVTEGLLANNSPPLGMRPLSLFAVKRDYTIRPLTADESSAINNLAADLRFIFR